MLGTVQRRNDNPVGVRNPKEAQERRGRLSPGRRSPGHGSGTACDDGMSAVELVINMVITGLVIASVGSMVSLSLRVFGAQEDVSEPPRRVVQRELARAAERMLVTERCDNPPGKTKRSECLEPAEVPFPLPAVGSSTTYTVPSMYNSADYEGVSCWMVESRGVSDADQAAREESFKPASGTDRNSDTRDLECWYLELGSRTVMIGVHHPSEKVNDTSDEYSPAWQADPYRVLLVASGVERMGYCADAVGETTGHDSPPATPPTDTSCESPNVWKRGWGCVPGVDTDAESFVESSDVDEPPEIPLDEYDCNNSSAALHKTISQGVAVLKLRLCASMSPAELERLSVEDRQGVPKAGGGWDKPPVTCRGGEVAVTPGRKSL